jgi:multiple sugar transport system substrate-binding protein
MRILSLRSLLVFCLLLMSLGQVSLDRAGSARAQDVCSDGINVPNQYNVPFCVRADELLIFAANYRPFESSVTEQRTAERFFDTVIGNRLRAAFPNVKIKYATWDYPVRYDELLNAGVVPALILENPVNIDRDLEQRGLVGDMTPLIEQSGIDLSQINQGAVEFVKSRSDGGIYGVPVFINDHVMFYNKKIFDKFRVRYPTVGMTYNQIYKLAKKLTVQDGLDAYKGYMQHPDTFLAYNQLGLYPFLPTTSEEPAPEEIRVNITSPEWKLLCANIEPFLLLPRNTFTTVDDFLKGDMSRPGHVAMAVNTLDKLPIYAGSELYIEDGEEPEYAEWRTSIDTGITSVPVLYNGSQTTYQPNMLAAFIPPQSDKKEQAIAIVKWLVSEQGQVELSRHAIKGVLQTPNVVLSFGAAIPELAGIDTSAIYWGTNAAVRNYQNTEYWNIPLFMVFRQHVLRDGMTAESSLIVTEEVDIPAYIKSRADAGQTY